jgi:uncharacterized protein
MILYLDTSSLIKIYVDEPGSEIVRHLLGQASIVSTSVIAYPESRAALGRLRREGTLTRLDHERSKRALENDWTRLLALNVTESVYRRAGDLAEKHGLRGFDSLHLASYLGLISQSEGQPVRFSSFDDSLNRAAR